MALLWYKSCQSINDDMNLNRWVLTLLASLALGARAAETLNLSGEGRFWRDDNQAGVQEKLFDAPLPGFTEIKLPGTMNDAKLGIPDPVKPSLAGLSGYAKGPWASLAEFNLIHP